MGTGIPISDFIMMQCLKNTKKKIIDIVHVKLCEPAQEKKKDISLDMHQNCIGLLSQSELAYII